jgi:hypothetical protein
MHSWGLYNGRYGMSDKVLLDALAGANRELAAHMLAGEEARQGRLTAALRADPETAAWVEERHLFQNYKQLQFFDTLALYFHCTHASERTATRFLHVPADAQRDVALSLTPQGGGRYALSPYPFAVDQLELTFSGRYLTPVAEGEHLRLEMAAAPEAVQRVLLCAGR